MMEWIVSICHPLFAASGSSPYHRKHILNRMKNKPLTLLAMIILSTATTFAQQQATGGQYFFNPYLVNPALGGTTAGLTVTGSIRKQFTNTPGAPLAQTLTAAYQLNERAAIGANFVHDKAGLLSTTRGLATFSYHLPLNEKTAKLHFGAGLGGARERINASEIVGDADPDIVALNDQTAQIDGSFGFALTTELFTLEGAIPQLTQVFARETLKNTVDRSLFFAAVAYRLKLGGSDQLSINPKIAYRAYRGIKNIIDAGAEVRLVNEQLRLMALYHSSQSASVGLSFEKETGFGIQAIYTTSVSSLQSPLGSNFELGLKLRIGNGE